MSLATAINNAVGSAFTAIDDLKTSGVATYIVSGVRDTENLTSLNTVGTDTVNIVQHDFTSMEKDKSNVRKDDVKFLIQISELTQNLKVYDFITVGSKKWNIESTILTEASDSIVIWHMRLMSE